MIRFKHRKKRGNNASDKSCPTVDLQLPSSFNTFEEKRTRDDEAGDEVDLSTVLPPADSFRTSLLMNGLSARFSLLREEDERICSPGKARDNTALHIKIQSGLEGLDRFQDWPHCDAEICFAQAASVDRFESHQFGEASTVSSLEGHSEPTEANSLMNDLQKTDNRAMSSRINLQGSEAASLSDKCTPTEKDSEQNHHAAEAETKISVTRMNSQTISFDDSDNGLIDNQHLPLVVAPHHTIERPDDRDHPAFRKSPVSDPLSVFCPDISNRRGSLSSSHFQDSPTLGYNTNLLDMARVCPQHDSTTLSVYSLPQPETEQSETEANGNTFSELYTTNERDEFTQHLAVLAQRVRERLTTRIGSDFFPVAGSDRGFVPRKSDGRSTLRTKWSHGTPFNTRKGERSNYMAAML